MTRPLESPRSEPLERARIRKSDRLSQILAELKLTPHVRVSDLAERFGVSTETIRRDIIELSEQGLVQRAFGGATIQPMGVQPAIGERSRTHVAERQAIAGYAAQLVSPGEVLMIDAGSTTTLLARRLAVIGRDLTVVTNSCLAAAALASNDSIQVILCPGRYMHSEDAVYGDETVNFLKRFNANRAFLGVGGLALNGLCDVNLRAASIKRAMIQQSAEALLLADSSKFDRPLFSVVAPLSSIDAVICDMSPRDALGEALASNGVMVHVCNEDG